MLEQGSPTFMKLRTTSWYRFMRRATTLIDTLSKWKSAQFFFNYVIINKNQRYSSMRRLWSRLCYCQNRPADDPRRLCWRLGARGYQVGDTCARAFHKKGVPRLTEHDDVTGAPVVKLARGPACLKSGPVSISSQDLLKMDFSISVYWRGVVHVSLVSQQARNQRGAIGQLPPFEIFTNVCIC